MKNYKVTLNINSEDKKVIERAAFYNKKSLSSYMKDVVINQAEKDLNNIILDNKERDALLLALSDIEIPNQDLINLFKI